MAAQLIDGKQLATELKARVREAITTRINAGGSRPGLAVVKVGDDPASQVYVRGIAVGKN
jgi:methylenetetrahydrofolate dehydrogenase (NADP+)/methenyltetrahydrofolate cyclohydrolase